MKPKEMRLTIYKERAAKLMCFCTRHVKQSLSF